MPAAKAEAVQVNIRFRPLMKFELDKDPELATRGPPFQLSGNQVLDQEVNKKWNYDTVMPYDTTQEQMYNAAAKGYVTDLMEEQSTLKTTISSITPHEMIGCTTVHYRACCVCFELSLLCFRSMTGREVDGQHVFCAYFVFYVFI